MQRDYHPWPSALVVAVVVTVAASVADLHIGHPVIAEIAADRLQPDIAGADGAHMRIDCNAVEHEIARARDIDMQRNGFAAGDVDRARAHDVDMHRAVDLRSREVTGAGDIEMKAPDRADIDRARTCDVSMHVLGIARLNLAGACGLDAEVAVDIRDDDLA